MKELNIENLTVEQKLGLVNIAYIGEDTANKKYILDLIKKRSLGGIWVVPTMDNATEIIAEMKSAADYPLLVFTDAENGINGYFIGKHNSLGLCDSEKLAYTFGKVTAITARKMGYNVVCNPILDMADGNYTCGGNVRSIGCDKYRVAAIASAEAKGMHDGGVLTLGKHYPGTCELQKEIDTHMAEAISEQTAEELLDYNLYHLKMVDIEDRKNRAALYNALDPNKEMQAIGYDYLFDDTNLKIEKINLKNRYDYKCLPKKYRKKF